MSAYSQFNGALPPTRRIFLFSTTYTPTVNTIATIYVVGGGGGGGGINPNYGGGFGGGGGCAVGIGIPLSSSVTYTVTVGAGGGRNYGRDNTQEYNNGTAGGTSSFSGAGITTLTANGGGFGGGSINGAGGTATGGTQNWRGGAGGGQTQSNSDPIRGGASGFFGDLNNGAYPEWPIGSFAYGFSPGTGSGSPYWQTGGFTGGPGFQTYVAGNWYAPKGGWGAGGGGALQFYSYNLAYGGQGGNGFVMIESMRL